jgi:hypothetical protein
MYKITYILEEGEQPHTRYFNALTEATALDMFESHYEEGGYSPQILTIKRVRVKKRVKTPSPAKF